MGQVVQTKITLKSQLPATACVHGDSWLKKGRTRLWKQEFCVNEKNWEHKFTQGQRINETIRNESRYVL